MSIGHPIQKQESDSDLTPCQLSDPEIWFDPQTQQVAIDYCNQCPLRLPCAEYALRIEANLEACSRYGVWGGLTPSQRASIARQVSA
jgi:hypothetical protein